MDFSLNFERAVTLSFDRADRTTEKSCFQKLDFPSSPWLLSRVHFTLESVLNDKLPEKHSSCWESPLYLYIPSFWDLYINSCVVSEQSTEMWAIAGKTPILAIADPFGWGTVTLKHRKGPFRAQAWIKWIKRSKAQAKDLRKLNWRHGKDAFWK